MKEFQIKCTVELQLISDTVSVLAEQFSTDIKHPHTVLYLKKVPSLINKNDVLQNVYILLFIQTNKPRTDGPEGST